MVEREIKKSASSFVSYARGHGSPPPSPSTALLKPPSPSSTLPPPPTFCLRPFSSSLKFDAAVKHTYIQESLIRPRDRFALTSAEILSPSPSPSPSSPPSRPPPQPPTFCPISISSSLMFDPTVKGSSCMAALFVHKLRGPIPFNKISKIPLMPVNPVTKHLRHRLLFSGSGSWSRFLKPKGALWIPPHPASDLAIPPTRGALWLPPRDASSASAKGDRVGLSEVLHRHLHEWKESTVLQSQEAEFKVLRSDFEKGDAKLRFKLCEQRDAHNVEIQQLKEYIGKIKNEHERGEKNMMEEMSKICTCEADDVQCSAMEHLLHLERGIW